MKPGETSGRRTAAALPASPIKGGYRGGEDPASGNLDLRPPTRAGSPSASPPRSNSRSASRRPITLAGNVRWKALGAKLQSAGPEAKVYVGKLPKRCLLTVQLVVPPTGRPGLWLGGDARTNGPFAWWSTLSPRRLTADRGPLPLGTNPERERNYRPIRIQPGDPVTLKVVLDGDAAVACLNDAVCLGTRIYDRHDNACGVWSDTVGTRIDGVQDCSR